MHAMFKCAMLSLALTAAIALGKGTDKVEMNLAGASILDDFLESVSLDVDLATTSCAFKKFDPTKSYGDGDDQHYNYCTQGVAGSCKATFCAGDSNNDCCEQCGTTCPTETAPPPAPPPCIGRFACAMAANAKKYGEQELAVAASGASCKSLSSSLTEPYPGEVKLRTGWVAGTDCVDVSKLTWIEPKDVKGKCQPGCFHLNGQSSCDTSYAETIFDHPKQDQYVGDVWTCKTSGDGKSCVGTFKGLPACPQTAPPTPPPTPPAPPPCIGRFACAMAANAKKYGEV